jgi:hypothetical protein
MNYIELFQAGGITLVLAVAFITFQWKIVRYFMQQMEKELAERKAEREQFHEALSNHCSMVQKALQKQEETFQELIMQIRVINSR